MHKKIITGSLLTLFFAMLSVGVMSCSAKEKKDEDKVPQATKEAELQDSTRLDSAKSDDSH